MKNFHQFIFILVITFATAFNIKAQITDYYYYNSKPYQLKLTYDQIFIEVNQNVDKSALDAILSQFPSLILNQNFNMKERRDFIGIINSLSRNELSYLIHSLNENPEILNASPVFKMPDGEGNPNTLIAAESEIIAQFKPEVSFNAINNYITQKNLSILQQFSLTGGSSYLLKIPKGGYSIDYANELFLSGLVNYSEPNLFFTNLLQDDPNDPFFSQQWSHRNTGNNIPGGTVGTPGCDMRTDSAWQYTMGDPNVIVAMVDTGIDTLHEDLSSRMIHGLSLDTYNNLPYAWDDNNHGTSTAGIVAAVGNNNLGVIGVAPLSRIFGVKIFSGSGNTNSNAIINGLIAAWQRGAWISSNSWGGGSPISAADNALQDGVNFGRNGKGIVWSFATGNENNSAISWPSNTPNVISVGGLSPCNQRKSTSSCDNEWWWGANYGTGLEIVAPAVKIYTTDRTGYAGYTSGNYVSDFNGTSSATPNVSGVCALVLAVDSNLTWDIVRERICETADKIGSYTYNQPGQLGLGGWNNEMGYGKINAYQVVKLTYESIPVELTSFAAYVVNDEVVINWNTATETNNRGYQIERKSYGQTKWESIGYIEGSGTTTQSKAYSFKDKEVNTGTYIYRLKQFDFDGTVSYSGEISVEVKLPLEYTLSQNYPNPFNPSTKIKYSVPELSNVRISVFNTLGEKVIELVNEQKNAGTYEINFNAQNLSSGLYFYRLETASKVVTKKMMLIR